MMDIVDVSLQAAAATHHLVGTLAKGRGLADQARRAAASVALNTAEGLAVRGAARAKALKVAYAECREAKTAVQLLAMTQQVDIEAARDAWRLLDRSGAMLWRLI